jgi:hypothetical protein
VILPADDRAARAALRPVVVEGDAGVIEEEHEARPHVDHVADGCGSFIPDKTPRFF